MIHHNGPFIPHYGPYRNYMEDGMPGTPLKIWGFLVGLIGCVAGGIVAISGLNPIIGAFVAINFYLFFDLLFNKYLLLNKVT